MDRGCNLAGVIACKAKGIGAAMVAIAALLTPFPAFSACNTPNNVALKVHFPDYPMWRAVAGQMQQCGNVDVEFGFDAASVEAESSGVKEELGSLVGISNASLYRLTARQRLRPLDDLVERYRVLLNPRQLIRVDGKVMAIAVAANTKALMVHRELLTQEKIETPRTYDELIAAAERLKGSSQLYDAPLTLAYRPGWNLTQEFIDLFIARGGELFSAEKQPSLSGEAGVATLELMKRLSAYLPEGYEERDSARVLNDLMRFAAPMAVTWVTHAGPLDNPAVSRVSGKMRILPAPAVLAGGKPAATLWWEGFAVPAGISEEEAEAAFLTALEGLDTDMLAEHRSQALWLIEDYKPGRLTREVLAAIDAGLPLYPDSPQLSLLRRAMNDHIEAFLSGEEDAATALEGAEADYLKAARELGMAG
ncbi:MAG: carbohydrate ABC transporter substrate-binding protein [Nitratireductor sp.]|nr:carbohydrate ABC transporter substrate-binding protein [Nitratireductor sp.]